MHSYLAGVGGVNVSAGKIVELVKKAMADEPVAGIGLAEVRRHDDTADNYEIDEETIFLSPATTPARAAARRWPCATC